MVQSDRQGLESIKIKKHTKRFNPYSMQTIINKIKPIQRGWFEYYKHCHKKTFSDVDGWTRRRLRSILKRREKRRGIATTYKDNIRYPNKIFDSYEFFSLARAHRELCQSFKWETCFLESRMRENRTYGSEGGEPSNGSLPYPYLDSIMHEAYIICVFPILSRRSSNLFR